MKRCIHCLRTASSEETKCKICKEETLYSKDNNHYIYQQQSYSQTEWYERWNTFKTNYSAYYMLRQPDRFVHPVYVKQLFIDNIRKTSVKALLLPGLFFLCLGFLTSTIILASQSGANWVTLSNQVETMFAFLTVFWFFCGIGLLLKKYIFQISCYRTRSRRQSQIKQLNTTERDAMISNLDQWIEHSRTQSPITFKKIDLERLVIREIQIQDTYAYFELLSSKKVCKYLANSPWKKVEQARQSIHQIEQEYREGQVFRLAIAIRQTNHMIGYIGISKIGLSEEGCEVVYALSDQHWNKGYATEALIGFREVLLNQYQKQWILATHMEKNTLSGNVMKKAGFNRDLSKDRTMMIRGQEEPLVAYIFWKNN